MGRSSLVFSVWGGLFALACARSSPPSVSAPVGGAAPTRDPSGPLAEPSPLPVIEDLSGPSRGAEAESGALEPAAPLPSGTKVLQVGDSFAGALGLPLGKLLEAEGVSSTLKHTDASYLTDWAWDGNLQKYIWRYNPDLIIVTLGANELEIQDPEARSKTIQKLVGTIGERPCVWVAIPLWAGPKNGLLEVIRENAEPCVYFDTNRLMDAAAMPRIRDGVHPTEAAREEWALVVLEWLKTHRKAEAGRPWSLRP